MKAMFVDSEKWHTKSEKNTGDFYFGDPETKISTDTAKTSP